MRKYVLFNKYLIEVNKNTAYVGFESDVPNWVDMTSKEKARRFNSIEEAKLYCKKNKWRKGEHEIEEVDE